MKTINITILLFGFLFLTGCVVAPEPYVQRGYNHGYYNNQGYYNQGYYDAPTIVAPPIVVSPYGGGWGGGWHGGRR